LPYFNGIIIPFARRANDQYNSNVIVKVLETETACFETKKRVPYKVVVETVE
jgi:phosphatidylinositol 4-kinase